MRRAGANAVNHSVDIGAQHSLQVLPVRLRQFAMLSDASVGDQDVQPPKLLNRLRHRCFHLRRLSDIAHCRQ